MATTDDNAKKILKDTEIISCDSIVSPSSFGSGGSNADCSPGLNIAAVIADMKCNTGWAWSRDNCGKSKEGPNHYDKIIVNGTDVTNKISVRHYKHITQCSGSGNWSKCTSSVAGHLVMGGFLWTGRTGNGYEMADFLRTTYKDSFKEITPPQDQCNTRSKVEALEKNNFFLPGDICCQEYPGNAGGHACMWNGEKWVSDFIQNHALVHGEGTYKVAFFRYKDCRSAGGTVNTNDMYMWIGDSQTAAQTFPDTVQSSLGISKDKFKVFGRCSARAKHYLNKEEPSSNGIYNTMGCSPQTCSAAYNYVTLNKPKYCFVALGHNVDTAENMNTLCYQLKQKGIKVILIKMWRFDNSFKKGKPEEVKKLNDQMTDSYKTASADAQYVIDLYDAITDTKDYKDGCHLNTSGYKKMGEKVAKELKKYFKSN